MTRRLTALIVGVVLATLLLVGGGTLVLANARARHTTERDLRASAEKVAANIDGTLGLSEITDPAQMRRRLRLVRRRSHRRRPRPPAAQEARRRPAARHRVGHRVQARMSRRPSRTHGVITLPSHLAGTLPT